MKSLNAQWRESALHWEMNAAASARVGARIACGVSIKTAAECWSRVDPDMIRPNPIAIDIAARIRLGLFTPRRRKI